MPFFVPIVLILALTVHHTEGACTFTDHTTALNTCIGAATGGTSAWGFPFGTTVQQANMCLTASLATLKTCIAAIFSGTCSGDAKTVKMFGTDGINVYNAISNLCAESLVTEAQACMSTANLATYTTSETSFKTNVDSLPSAASQVEICGLVTTLKYQAYDVQLTTLCTVTSHREVWQRFYSTLIDTYACTICSSADKSSKVELALGVLSFIFSIILQ